MSQLEITIDNLHEVTAQQVFDYVIGKIREQGRSSMIDGGCAYRGENGTKCAAGWLLSDEHIEQLRGHMYLWRRLATDGLVPAYHALLIQELQTAHDIAAISTVSDSFLPIFEDQALKASKSFKLNYNALVSV